MKPLFPTLFPTDFFDQFESAFHHMEAWDPGTSTFSILKGFPKGDIFFDKEGNRVIELALAGYTKDQLSVTIGDDKLTVSAIKCKETEEDCKRSYTRARRAFTQEFTNLGGRDFDLEQTEVTYKNGLLCIVVPKKEPEEPALKTIEIK